MLKNKYTIQPDKNIENINELKAFCKVFFNKLGYNVEFIEKNDTFHIYLNIENYSFKVTLRLLGPSLVQYKIPLNKINTPMFGVQQIVIKKF